MGRISEILPGSRSYRLRFPEKADIMERQSVFLSRRRLRRKSSEEKRQIHERKRKNRKA